MRWSEAVSIANEDASLVVPLPKRIADLRLVTRWHQSFDCEECRRTQQTASNRTDNNTPETFHGLMFLYSHIRPKGGDGASLERVNLNGQLRSKRREAPVKESSLDCEIE